MLYKLVSVREILRNKVGIIFLYFEAKLIKSVFHSLLVRDDYSQLGPTGWLALCHLISNARPWNNFLSIMCLQETLALPDTDNVCIVVKEEEKKEHSLSKDPS